jgi:drug/metabolite transporter (DMT)-like permease
MINILLCILSSTLIFILFKLIDRFKAFTFQSIIINYLVAFILGLSISSDWGNLSQVHEKSWFILSLILGILFIVTFFFIGVSSQKAGISITTVACKMSVIVPVAFSILFYSEAVTSFKIIGLVVSLVALLLTIWRKPEKKQDLFVVILPFILFIGIGVIDTLVKYAQQDYVKNDVSFFTAVSFGVSLIAGLIAGFTRKNFLKGFQNFSTITLGIMLGMANFGSVYFMINALNKSGLESSVVFGINNIGIVTISVFVGLIFFKEKLKFINWSGVFLSIIAIWLLMGMHGF